MIVIGIMKNVKIAFLKTVAALGGGVALHSTGDEPLTSSTSLLAGLGQPEVSANAPAAPASATPSGWPEDIGANFSKGSNEAGISLGASEGAHIFGGTKTHDFALAKVLVGHVISSEVASDRWYRGEWELLGEVFGGGQFEPGSAYVVGVTPGVRYNFATGSRWVPFFDAGAGVSATDIGRPDLGGKFQFNLQTGPGVRWFVEKNVAVTLQYRYLHLSSAGSELPNAGVNTSVFYVGVTWFF